MFCQYCGQENSDKNSFCIRCGRPLNDNTSEAGGEKRTVSLEEFERKLSNALKSGAGSIQNAAKEMKKEDIFKYSKIAYFISAIVALFSPFLPFVSVGAFGISYNINFIYTSEYGDGQVLDGVFLIGLAVLALIMLKFDKKPGMAITGAISAFLIIFEITQMNRMISEVGSRYAKAGAGFYLCCISSFVLCSSGILYYVLDRKLNPKLTSTNAMQMNAAHKDAKERQHETWVSEADKLDEGFYYDEKYSSAEEAAFAQKFWEQRRADLWAEREAEENDPRVSEADKLKARVVGHDVGSDDKSSESKAVHMIRSYEGLSQEDIDDGFYIEYSEEEYRALQQRAREQ